MSVGVKTPSAKPNMGQIFKITEVLFRLTVMPRALLHVPW